MPGMGSRQTTSTLLSTDLGSFTSSYNVASTAMTTPDMEMTKRYSGKLDPMLNVFGGPPLSTVSEDRSKIRDTDVTRGPSVRQRASQFERFDAQAGPSTSRSMIQPTMNRRRSTSPLRINRPLPTPTQTPTPQRRIPVPSTAPPRTTQERGRIPSTEVTPTKHKSPQKLARGSTKKMVQQWENRPSEPQQMRISSGNFSKKYLEEKPLPSPDTVYPISNYSTPSKSYGALQTARAPHSASPLHLQTPRRQSTTLASTSSSWSLSPNKRKKNGRSPLKEMLTVFGGGILRKGKAKSKDKWEGDYASSVGLDRIGSAGLPGGIVFHDRMGDQEMRRPVVDVDVIRSSAIIYLIATPCSSVSSWGSWLTSWGSLTPTHLKVTYCPVFQDPQAGYSSPKRVFSGASQPKGSDASFAWNAITAPEAGTVPDVEMSMHDCVEVRSLRREEVKGRGVPAVPHPGDTEVLEMVFTDGSKRYFGVEGVAGRLGWVSAIWDVLLACKTNGIATLPPPSPAASPSPAVIAGHPFQSASVPIETYPQSLTPPGRPLSPKPRISSGSTLKESRGDSTAPPVQKMGDRWIAASSLGASEVGSIRRSEASSTHLRESVHRMFESNPTTPMTDPTERLTTPVGSEVNDRIIAWQPTTERELSIFSRNDSKRSMGDKRLKAFPELDGISSYPRTESTLSFDPNDLNPSRSASQVRRHPTLIKRNAVNDLPAVEESSHPQGDNDSILPDPTHLSHVTFPKPTVAGLRIAAPSVARHVRTLETIPSATNSSIETDPHTAELSIETAPTTHSSSDHTIMAKLESQSAEHELLTQLFGGLHGNLQQVLSSVNLLGATAKSNKEEAETRIPKALEDKLSAIGLDVKAIENTMALSQLSTSRLTSAETPMDPNMAALHRKLDTIAKFCSDLLSKNPVVAPAVKAEAENKAGDDDKGEAKLGIVMDPAEEKSAGDEIAEIMADKTGPTIKSAEVEVHSDPDAAVSAKEPTLTEDIKKQLGEVFAVVSELKEARSLQTQQTTDIARYLNELNSWLEKFVHNSTSEITSMSKRLTAIVGSDPEPGVEKQLGMPDLVADMHSILSDQKRRIEAEGSVNQRIDGLLDMMGQERERTAGQSAMVEQVISALDRQRGDNEMLLRALATDLTTEIRGERIRFVEAMQQATTMNISVHVEEFKKTLSAEVGKAMQELGQLREERQALEAQIADLFALKAKHGTSGAAKKGVPAAKPPAGAAHTSAPVGGPPATPTGPKTGGGVPPSPAMSHLSAFAGVPGVGYRHLPAPPPHGSATPSPAPHA